MGSMKAAVLLASTWGASASWFGSHSEKPCCQGQCQQAGLEKYWSIAKGVLGQTHCGECCMDPKKYNLFHLFEKNLTKSTESNPCEVRGYTKYETTETHGFGPVSMTLDLYDMPDAAEEPCCQ